MAMFQIINHGNDELTAKQAAQVLNTTVDAIYDLIDSDKLQLINHKDYDSVTIESLQEYLDSLRYLIVLGSTDYFNGVSRIRIVDRKSGEKNNEESDCIWYGIEE